MKELVLKILNSEEFENIVEPLREQFCESCDSEISYEEIIEEFKSELKKAKDIDELIDNLNEFEFEVKCKKCHIYNFSEDAETIKNELEVLFEDLIK